MIDFLSSPLANTLALTLLHFLWQGLLVALGYRVLQNAAGVQSARSRYSGALVALVFMMACPPMTFMAIHDPATTMTGAAPLETAMEPDVAAVVTGTGAALQHDRTIESVSVENTAGHQSATESGGLTVESVLSALNPYILLLWMGGVMLSGARLLGGLANVARLRFGRTGITADLAERSEQIARRLGLKTAAVFSSAYIREAAVVGFWRPVVLLPTSWLIALPSDVLEAVIAHELAHVRRNDVWVNLFQRVLETLLFYHPAVWWLSNQARLEREMCCDEMAVHATGELGTYAIALEQVGRLQTHETLQLAPTFTGDERMNLLNRIRHVLGVHRSPDREPAWLVGMVALSIPLVLAGVVAISTSPNSASAQEGEGGRARESEEGARRSPEAVAGPRRSAEAEAGPRRSAEAAAGRRESAEGEGRRRSSEADGAQVLESFRPQTEREAALFEMIVQLQREVARLREDSRRTSDREDRPAGGRRDGEIPELASGWERTREGGVFQSYDHNDDEFVSLDEWLAMTNGNINEARRQLQTDRFRDTDPGSDGKLSPSEFIYWYTEGRFADRRRGERDGDGGRSAEGDAGAQRSGEGEGRRRSPEAEGGRNRSAEREREGEGGARRGSADGEIRLRDRR